MKNSILLARGGFGSIVSTFIRWIIYDICVTGISDIFGVSRMVALFIFLGLSLAVSAGIYLMKQKSSRGADDY
jgi:hypothetical protein